MSDGNSIINLGDISKPAVVLIEKIWLYRILYVNVNYKHFGAVWPGWKLWKLVKSSKTSIENPEEPKISDAIGGYSKPYQIRQVARAEADAEIIKALAQIEITELQQRALHRFAFEEAKKQDNIESITAKALPYLKEDADPNSVENDWITNFFDKCRLISDEQMQALWAELLAGEANSPGSYSKRTVDLLSSFDKADAVLFKTLCGFGWLIGNVVPLIYDEQASIYKDHGIDFNALGHLNAIGLISFGSIGGYKRLRIPRHVCIFYYGTPVNIEFPGEQDNELDTGKILLTRAGQELVSVSDSAPISGFLDYILVTWREKGLIVSSPYPRILPSSNPSAET